MATEQQIIEAATKVFLEKGYHGASVRDIAAEAGANVSMINYYFRSKERLFDVVFDKLFGILFAEIGGALDSELSFFDKIDKIVASYIDTLRLSPMIPVFVFGELSRNPHTVLCKMQRNGRFLTVLGDMERLIDEQVRASVIKPTSAVDLLINIISLSVFPFVSRPVITAVGAVDERQFDAWVESRKQSVTQFVVDAIKI